MTDQADLTYRILQDLQQRMIDLDRKVTSLDRKVEEGFLNLHVRMTAFEGRLDVSNISQTALIRSVR